MELGKAVEVREETEGGGGEVAEARTLAEARVGVAAKGGSEEGGCEGGGQKVAEHGGGGEVDGGMVV